jgi:valyl-tRNA synthetase
MGRIFGAEESAALQKFSSIPEAINSPFLSEDEKVATLHFYETTRAFNSLRSLVHHHPGTSAEGVVRVHQDLARFQKYFEQWKKYVQTLAKLSSLKWELLSEERSANLVYSPVPHIGEVGIVPPEDFDLEKTLSTLRKRHEEAKRIIERKSQLGRNPEFIEKASEETRNTIVNELIELAHQEGMLRAQISLLEASHRQSRGNFPAA